MVDLTNCEKVKVKKIEPLGGDHKAARAEDSLALRTGGGNGKDNPSYPSKVGKITLIKMEVALQCTQKWIGFDWILLETTLQC